MSATYYLQINGTDYQLWTPEDEREIAALDILDKARKLVVDGGPGAVKFNVVLNGQREPIDLWVAAENVVTALVYERESPTPYVA
jgi:hypothetical protein